MITSRNGAIKICTVCLYLHQTENFGNKRLNLRWTPTGFQPMDPDDDDDDDSAVPSRSTAPSPIHAASYTATLDLIAPCPTDTGHLISQPPKTGLATRSNTPLMIASKVGGVATSTVAQLN